jgi:hypothetical protein
MTTEVMALEARRDLARSLFFETMRAFIAPNDVSRRRTIPSAVEGIA